MPLPTDLPVVDHHCHLSPSGEGVEAARRFAHAGGTHLFLATQQYGPKTPSTLDEYREQFETTENLARRVTEATGVIVYLVVAPYPVDFLRILPSLGRSGSVELHRSALELAGRWVQQQRAVALGEVGRPHFPVEAEVARTSEELFRYALEVARDVGAPVVVHCADLDAEGYHGLATLAAQCSFPLAKLIKHYARTVYSPVDLAGVVPSYVARRETVKEAMDRPGPWFLETDFLDDPRRPGAVLDLATVPRRAAAMAALSEDGVERLRTPFVESVRSVYGFVPKSPKGVV